MPYSLVLNLLPQSAIPASHLTGRHLHALFLDLVRSVNPDLSTALHGQEAKKAFTLSPLQRCRRDEVLEWEHRRAISAGTACWWRISLLDEGLFGQLAHLWLSLSPQQSWRLGAAELQVVSVLSSPLAGHPWAGYTTYRSLYENASEDDRQIHLRFCTPTAFRKKEFDSALPSPELVFWSLLKHWNQYSGQPFEESIIEHLYPSFFDIRTEMTSDSRSKFIGCVGAMTFRMLGEVSAETIKQINTLADFAFYTGVGRKTPMGMGMVRREFLKRK